MDIEVSAIFLASTILMSLGFITIVITVVVVNISYTNIGKVLDGNYFQYTLIKKK